MGGIENMRNIVTQFLAIGLVRLSAGAHGAEPSELKTFPDANEELLSNLVFSRMNQAAT